MNGASLQIFRAGRHRAMSGVEIEFSADDLAASAAAYDPALHEAPLVVGHPTLDAPAYGWVGALSARDGSLEASPRQVDQAFAELVRGGKFKKVSPAFYPPDHADNPKPGIYYLRHVGFLGAQPPAVKGLRPIEFADDVDGVVVFADAIDRDVATLFRRLREWIIGKFGAEDADAAVPGWAVDYVQEVAAADEPAQAFGEEDDDMTKAELERLERKLAEEKQALDARAAKVEQQEAAFAERESQLAAESQKRRKIEVAAFVETLAKDGRILPRHQAGLTECLLAWPADAVIEFGEGDDAHKGAPDAWLRDFLGELPGRIEYAELAPGYLQAPDAGANDEEIAHRARKYREQRIEQGARLSFAEAVDAVRRGDDRDAA